MWKKWQFCLQQVKVYWFIIVTKGGISKQLSDTHPKKHLHPIYVIEWGILIFDREVHSLNVLSLIFVTWLGIMSLSNDKTFRWRFSLVQMSIPTTVTNIGSQAFYCCSSLEKIMIPRSVKLIGEMAFSGCHSLKTIEIPSYVESLGCQEWFSLEKSVYFYTID